MDILILITNEEWINIKSLNYRYSVSNLGRVKKNYEIIIRNNGRRQVLNEKILKPILNVYGYLKVRCNISRNVIKNIYIHRLVAENFLQRDNKSLQVNHKNGIKTDNCVNNLEWVSCKENINHSWELNLSTNNHSKKETIINGVSYPSRTEAIKCLNITKHQLYKLLNQQL